MHIFNSIGKNPAWLFSQKDSNCLQLHVLGIDFIER